MAHPFCSKNIARISPRERESIKNLFENSEYSLQTIGYPLINSYLRPLEDLLKPEKKAKLVSILTYHVVPKEMMAANVVKQKRAKTVQGSFIKIKTMDGKVMINNAQVVKTDIMATNGVIHVIDAVVLPK